MIKTIAIIPARGGSKRLPGKNVKLLDEQPLIVHSIKYAQTFKGIDEVFVSTDDLQIKKISLAAGAQVIDRPKKLSGDHELTVTVLKNVLDQLPYEVEDIVLLQPTNPLRPKNLLQDAFGKYIEGNFDSLITITENREKLGKIKNGKFVPYNYTLGQRSQDMEPLYVENGLLYISKAYLLNKCILIGENHTTFEVNHAFAKVDIDTLEDFEYAEYLLKSHKK